MEELINLAGPGFVLDTLGTRGDFLELGPGRAPGSPDVSVRNLWWHLSEPAVTFIAQSGVTEP